MSMFIGNKALESIQNLAKSAVDLKRFNIFLYNLSAQETDIFKEMVAPLKGITWYEMKMPLISGRR